MDDLDKPLGTEKGQGGRITPALLGALATLGLLGALGWWLIADSSSGPVRVAIGEPPAANDAAKGGNKVIVEVVEQPAKNTPTPAKPPAEGTSPQPAAKPQAPSFKPEQARQTNAPTWRPDNDLVEASAYGPLPRISDGNLRPLDAYSVPVGAVGASRIAIVVGGMGLSQTGTKKAIEDLPSEITLAFAPSGNSLQRWMEMARKEGHETILQLPMEPLGYPAVNPGPRTLVSGADDRTNIDNLHRLLGRLTNYPIVMNYLGAGLTSNPDALEPVLAEIKARGLGWFDDGSAQASRSIEMAQQMRLPYVAGTLIIDSKQDVAAIRAQLKALELLAKRRGFAVGTAAAFPGSVAEIAKWSEVADKQGVQIVPLSNLVKDFSR